MLVINMFAGPGSGKTSLALAVAAKLKLRPSPIRVEYVDEVAKVFAVEGRKDAISNQILVLAKQFQAIGNHWGKTDIVVTDGPMLHGMIYAKRLGYPESFFDLCLWCHRQFDNMSVFVERPTDVPFEQTGRLQNYDQSRSIDNEIRAMLTKNHLPVEVVGPPIDATVDAVCKLALDRLKGAKSGEPKSWFDAIRPREYQRDVA